MKKKTNKEIEYKFDPKVVPKGCIYSRYTLRDVSNDLLEVIAITGKEGNIVSIEDMKGQMITASSLWEYNKRHLLFNKSQLTELFKTYGFRKRKA